MAENDEPEVQKKVIVEQIQTSGTTRNSMPVIITILVIALALVIFIVLQMR